jgi:hypothetical protein
MYCTREGGFGRSTSEVIMAQMLLAKQNFDSHHQTEKSNATDGIYFPFSIYDNFYID